MRPIGLALFAFALALSPLGAAAAPADDSAAAVAALNQILDTFNKGDTKAFLAMCTPQVSIIDNIPPHAFSSCAEWMKTYGTLAKAHGDTDGAVKLVGKPTHVDISGPYAYIVTQASYEFKEHGKPMAERNATWTIVLKKTAAGYRLSGSGWAEGTR